MSSQKTTGTTLYTFVQPNMTSIAKTMGHSKGGAEYRIFGCKYLLSTVLVRWQKAKSDFR